MVPPGPPCGKPCNVENFFPICFVFPALYVPNIFTHTVYGVQHVCAFFLFFPPFCFLYYFLNPYPPETEVQSEYGFLKISKKKKK